MTFQKKITATAAMVLLAATLALGASFFYAPGTIAVSLNAVATTGAGDSYQFVPRNNSYPTAITWQTIYTGTPTAITVNLEGCLTNCATAANWATLDSSTSTANEMRHVVYKAVPFVRCNISAYTVNGSTATCQFVATSQ